MKKYDLLAVGGVYVDIIATNMPFDESGLSVEREYVGPEYEMVAGGSALNFERLCAALDMNTVMVGKVGHDRAGRLLEELIHEAGILPALVLDPAVTTNVSTNLVNA